MFNSSGAQLLFSNLETQRETEIDKKKRGSHQSITPPSLELPMVHSTLGLQYRASRNIGNSWVSHLLAPHIPLKHEILLSAFLKCQGHRNIPFHFYETNITLIPKAETYKKGDNYRPIPLINTDAKMLNAIVIN